MLLKGFAPIVSAHPKAMILGSMPSVTSLEKQEYYGFKHNRFWKIMSAYFQVELQDYEAKRQLILDHDLILWDVIGSCEREGSLDSAIRKETCNAIVELYEQYADIQWILCNGRKSYDLYQKHFASKIDAVCVCMPSTSNANRSIKETALFAKWFAQLDNIYKT